jgi:uncharacterized protein (TIGR02996 family)
MNDENAFLDAIAANPDDEELRQVYADWLEERGDPRAEFLRLATSLAALPAAEKRADKLKARLRALQPGIDAKWLALMDRAPVEGCFRFAYQCPSQWQHLKQTDDPSIRFCETCEKKVFYCPTVDHAQRHALRGHCVAINSGLVRRKDDLETDPGRDPEVMIAGEVELPLPRYRPGQQVTVQAGPLKGLTGEVEQVHLSELRLTVSLDSSGQRRSVQLAFEDVDDPELMLELGMDDDEMDDEWEDDEEAGDDDE